MDDEAMPETLAAEIARINKSMAEFRRRLERLERFAPRVMDDTGSAEDTQ